MEPISLSLRFLFGAFSVLLLLGFFYLLQKREIELRHSFIWFFVAIAGIVFSIFPLSLIVLGHWLGFQIPANAVLSLAILVLSFLSLTQSVSIAKTKRDLTQLAQALAKDRVTKK